MIVGLHVGKIKVPGLEKKGFWVTFISRGGSYQKVKKLSPLIGVMIKFKVYETHFL
jgi:hypothetical protein